jgi:hypothetical protein
MCLVAIEPVSKFILLEQYQPQRDAATWNACMDQVLGNLPITAIQCTTDEAKARRVLTALIATISFYWSTVKMRLCKWNLPQPVAALMISDLIPAHYLQIAAAKASTSQERQRLRELSQLIFARARSPTGVWATLDPQIQEDLEQKALRCAQIFQRSSSCVEGHKGHLSLKHHALHRLTSTRLQALKVLHNYAAYRTDGTTAAERFYGEPPRDIFTWTLDRLDLPARPRTSRAN